VNQFKIKRKRERQKGWSFRFSAYLAICVGALFVISSFVSLFRPGVFTIKHVLIFSIGAIPLCAIMSSIVERLGSLLGGLLSGWSSRRATDRETLAADMGKARYSKREGRFQEALTIINGVLTKDPDYPDALFLKARVLWEGFKKGGSAKACLRKVMQLVSRDEALHRWASSYYDEVIEAEKREVTHAWHEKR
jgi:hypothetical protein